MWTERTWFSLRSRVAWSGLSRYAYTTIKFHTMYWRTAKVLMGLRRSGRSGHPLFAYVIWLVFSSHGSDSICTQKWLAVWIEIKFPFMVAMVTEVGHLYYSRVKVHLFLKITCEHSCILNWCFHILRNCLSSVNLSFWYSAFNGWIFENQSKMPIFLISTDLSIFCYLSNHKI